MRTRKFASEIYWPLITKPKLPVLFGPCSNILCHTLVDEYACFSDRNYIRNFCWNTWKKSWRIPIPYKYMQKSIWCISTFLDGIHGILQTASEFFKNSSEISSWLCLSRYLLFWSLLPAMAECNFFSQAKVVNSDFFANPDFLGKFMQIICPKVSSRRDQKCALIKSMDYN